MMLAPRPNVIKSISMRGRRVHGFAATTVLFTIMLFALVGAAATSISRSNAKAQLFHETKEKMVAQSALILNTLILCRTVYPAGDNLTGFHSQYPGTPGNGLVSSLVCPGQSPTLLWSGDAFAIAPLALPGYSAWTYVNDAASIRISTTANNTNNQYYRDLLDAVVAKVGANQAVRSSDTLTITLFN